MSENFSTCSCALCLDRRRSVSTCSCALCVDQVHLLLAIYCLVHLFTAILSTHTHTSQAHGQRSSACVPYTQACIISENSARRRVNAMVVNHALLGLYNGYVTTRCTIRMNCS